MYYKKLISCLLAVVLILQVVSVGGVASAGPAPTALEQLNEIKNSYEDIEGAISSVQSILTSGSLIDITDIMTTYNLLTQEQKNELARGMILLLPREIEYENQSQVEYVFALLYNLVKLPKETSPDTVQYILNEIYGLYSHAGSFLPSDQAEPMVEESATYSTLRGADKAMYTNIVMFEAALGKYETPIYYNGQIQLLMDLISRYLPINVPNNISDMEATLDSMFGHYFMTMMFGMDPSVTVQPFPVNMDKMSNISGEKKIELAQWMIDHKSQNGYGTVSEVQATFDAFFAPEAPLVTADDEANVIVGADDTMEYSQNEGGNWIEYSPTDPPQFGGDRIVWVRVKMSGNIPASKYTILEFTENKETDPLESLNFAKSNEDVSGVLSALQDAKLELTLPVDFSDWSNDEKESVGVFVTLMNGTMGYVSKAQVQYVLDLAIEPRNLFSKRELTDVQLSITAYFAKFLNLTNVFSENLDPSIQTLYNIGKKYDDLSWVDKQIFAYRMTFYSMRDATPAYQNRDELSAELSTYNPINNVTNQTKMYNALVHLRLVQKESVQYNNNPTTIEYIAEFPLNLDKVDDIDYATYRQLAQWMIDKKPITGYTSYEEIQQVFNSFFNSDITPLQKVNEARVNKNIDAMRLAMENPDLGITLPNGYGALSSQERTFIAGFLIDYVKNDYRNKDQVQYMIELAVLAQSIWGQKEFDVLKNKLDLFAQKLVDGPDYFNDQQTYVLRSMGQQHLVRSQVDKGVFAYKYLHLVAFERLEGEFKGNIVNPDIVLSLFSMPLESFENAASIPLMDEWLDHAMNEWIAGEAFFDNYKFRRTGALDLSKRADLSPEGRKELAEWVLNEQDRYEDVGNLQYVINRFFTAPNVTGNDINNTITGLDDTMEISLNGKLNWIDVASIQKFDFSGDKTVWVRYKAISDLLPGRAVKIVFTANGDSNNGNGSTPNPNPGGSTGGGSSATTPVTTTPTTKQEQIVVDVNGANGTNLTKTPITRTTEADGTIKDLVKMSEAIAKESVEKAKQLNMNTARIVIPDAKDAVSETRIELPKAAVKQLNDGGLNLEISTENAIISVPTKSIAGFDQDLYFRVVPLKKESERKEVEERAKKEQLIQQITPNSNVKVLARPVEIETNMQSHEVTLTLPLRDSLPTDPAARQQALDNLAVYIEHSDGTKELIQGKLVNLSDSSEGIEFTVNKFSTFTLVVVDGLKASQGSHNPYINGFGADFRPDAFVTRAQMAAMLARNLSDEAGTASANVVNYDDVSPTHWAASDIEKAQSAGIMNGMNATQFAPEGSITRAQMAIIAYRWIQQQSADASSSTTQATDGAGFTDVSADLWASDAITYVQAAGLMTGYNDGTFKPNSKLTRAEAVKVLNVLFKRTPVTGVTTPAFTDVPATHWAYADIEAAAQK